MGAYHNDTLSLDAQRTAIAQVSAIAKANHDRVMEGIAKDGNVIKLSNEVDKRKLIANQLEATGVKAEQAKNQLDAINDFRKQHPKATSADINLEWQRLTGKGMSEEETDSLAQMLANGQLPVSAYTLRSPAMAGALAKAKELNPNFQGQTYAMRAALMKSLTSGPLAQNVTSLRTVQGHLQSLQELAGDLQNGDVTAANAVINRIGRETGHPEVTNFNAAKELVGTEITRAVVGSGSGSGALADREAIKDAFSSASSPEQLMGSIGTFKSLISSRLESLSQQIRTGGVDPAQYGITPDLLQFFRAPSAPARQLSASDMRASVANAADAIKSGKDPSAVISRLRAAGISDEQMHEGGLNIVGY